MQTTPRAAAKQSNALNESAQFSSSSDGDLCVPDYIRPDSVVASVVEDETTEIGSASYPLTVFCPQRSRNKGNKTYTSFRRLLEKSGSRLPKKVDKKFSRESLGQASSFDCCTKTCC